MSKQVCEKYKSAGGTVHVHKANNNSNNIWQCIELVLNRFE